MNIRFPKQFITRDESRDFKDDGNSFKGYIYKSTIPITYLRDGYDLYCSIRLDYLMDWGEYEPVAHEMEEYNGYRADWFNMDHFLENCEKVYQFYINSQTLEYKKERLTKRIAELTAEINKLEEQKLQLEQDRKTFNEQLASL